MSKEIKSEHLEVAIFAGGCFWCMQGPFDYADGVLKTKVGYIDGKIKNPTYQEVCQGTTGHTEAIKITFDKRIISYQELLTIFWRNIDPTDSQGQFADKGNQYRTGIYTVNKEQQDLAQNSKRELEESNKFTQPIAVEIKPASIFYPAEEYHQEYYKKNPLHYRQYYIGSGRSAYIEKNRGA